jgi:hypothetical protein
LQRLQFWLPLNPQGLANIAADSAFDTAVSFVTNTNWQGYSGESTMSYLTQMLGLTVQNFLSAATGIAPHRAKFPVGGDRHRRGICLDARLRAPRRERHRQFLGRLDARHPLHPAAFFPSSGPFLHVAGRHPEFRLV